MSERILTGVAIQDAASKLEVSRRTVERYVSAGRLDAYRTHTGRVYITQESIDRLLQPVPVALAEGGEA